MELENLFQRHRLRPWCRVCGHPLLADLSALQEWIDAGAKGTFVADCRITSSVRAPWMSEWMEAKQAKQPA